LGAVAGRKKRAGVLAAGHGKEENGCSPPAVGRKRRGARHRLQGRREGVVELDIEGGQI
jgi:hypothetical protein